MDDLIHPGEALFRLRAQQSVGVRDDADPHRFSTGRNSGWARHSPRV
jgi:hypothetical protein